MKKRGGATAKKRTPLRAVARGTIRLFVDGFFLEVSNTKETVGLLALGALLGTPRWKNKKVRITISEVR